MSEKPIERIRKVIESLPLTDEEVDAMMEAFQEFPESDHAEILSLYDDIVEANPDYFVEYFKAMRQEEAAKKPG